MKTVFSLKKLVYFFLFLFVKAYSSSNYPSIKIDAPIWGESSKVYININGTEIQLSPRTQPYLFDTLSVYPILSDPDTSMWMQVEQESILEVSNSYNRFLNIKRKLESEKILGFLPLDIYYLENKNYSNKNKSLGRQRQVAIEAFVELDKLAKNRKNPWIWFYRGLSAGQLRAVKPAIQDLQRAQKAFLDINLKKESKFSRRMIDRINQLVTNKPEYYIDNPNKCPKYALSNIKETDDPVSLCTLIFCARSQQRRLKKDQALTQQIDISIERLNSRDEIPAEKIEIFECLLNLHSYLDEESSAHDLLEKIFIWSINSNNSQLTTKSWIELNNRLNKDFAFEKWRSIFQRYRNIIEKIWSNDEILLQQVMNRHLDHKELLLRFKILGVPEDETEFWINFIKSNRHIKKTKEKFFSLLGSYLDNHPSSVYLKIKPTTFFEKKGDYIIYVIMQLLQDPKGVKKLRILIEDGMVEMTRLYHVLQLSEAITDNIESIRYLASKKSAPEYLRIYLRLYDTVKNGFKYEYDFSQYLDNTNLGTTLFLYLLYENPSLDKLKSINLLKEKKNIETIKLFSQRISTYQRNNNPESFVHLLSSMGELFLILGTAQELSTTTQINEISFEDIRAVLYSKKNRPILKKLLLDLLYNSNTLTLEQSSRLVNFISDLFNDPIIKPNMLSDLFSRNNNETLSILLECITTSNDNCPSRQTTRGMNIILNKVIENVFFERDAVLKKLRLITAKTDFPIHDRKLTSNFSDLFSRWIHLLIANVEYVKPQFTDDEWIFIRGFEFALNLLEQKYDNAYKNLEILANSQSSTAITKDIVLLSKSYLSSEPKHIMEFALSMSTPLAKSIALSNPAIYKKMSKEDISTWFQDINEIYPPHTSNYIIRFITSFNFALACTNPQSKPQNNLYSYDSVFGFMNRMPRVKNETIAFQFHPSTIKLLPHVLPYYLPSTEEENFYPNVQLGVGVGSTSGFLMKYSYDIDVMCREVCLFRFAMAESRNKEAEKHLTKIMQIPVTEELINKLTDEEAKSLFNSSQNDESDRKNQIIFNQVSMDSWLYNVDKLFSFLLNTNKQKLEYLKTPIEQLANRYLVNSKNPLKKIELIIKIELLNKKLNFPTLFEQIFK